MSVPCPKCGQEVHWGNNYDCFCEDVEALASFTPKRHVREVYADEIWQLNEASDSHGLPIRGYGHYSNTTSWEILLNSAWEIINKGDYIIRTGDTYEVVSKEKYKAMKWRCE